MDKKDIQSIIQETVEDEFPASEINLWQTVKASLVEKQTQQGVTMNNNKLRLTYATLTIAILLAFVFFTPQGRAWAQEAFQFFRRINSSTIELPSEQAKTVNEMMDDFNKPYDLPLLPVIIPAVSPDMAAIAGCETPQKAQKYHCQVALAESQLGFDLKELPENLQGWRLQSVQTSAQTHSATMTFELEYKIDGSFVSYSSLLFTQGIGEPPQGDVVPAVEVESVFVGAYPGEYVKGRFSLKLDDGIDVWIWDEIDRQQRLVWEDDKRWYRIEYWPNLNKAGTLGRDELIHLAKSLADTSAEAVNPLDLDHLLSISDAEKASGLDLKSPAFLPMETDFQYARYLPREGQVQLIYGQDESLIIKEWQGKPVEFKKPLNKYEFDCDTVDMVGIQAFYCYFNGRNLRSFLWWHKDGVNYQMTFDSFIGGQIDKEKMLLIAESMQDIDDYRKKDYRKRYEQIVLYEQALGLDAKKFPETPVGWEYADFWGDARSQCIHLMYRSTSRQGSLLVSQCKTDKLFDITAFPFWMKDRVKVRGAKGWYISGNYLLTDNGKQVWDSTAPGRVLYWEEDGIQTRIILYGGTAVQADENDLITLAESLK